MRLPVCRIVEELPDPGPAEAAQQPVPAGAHAVSAGGAAVGTAA